jgi:hypothetical protein
LGTALAAAIACVMSVPAFAAPTSPAAWGRWLSIPGVTDVSGPRSDGRLIVTADKLYLVDPRSGAMEPFAPSYTPVSAGEPYMALSTGLAVPGEGCSFSRDDLYVLALQPAGAVLRIDPSGVVSQFANVPSTEVLYGITFDTIGGFGHRLLVTGVNRGQTFVSAIDCAGKVTDVTRNAPRMEGGLTVAPPGFGHFEGDLVAPDEISGDLLAIRPDGTSSVIVHSGLPAGPDIGVEGVGFVPKGLDATAEAYFSDRATPGGAHPGTNSLLRLEGADLIGAGVRPGDLLSATEGGATLIDVRCPGACQVTTVAVGPSVAHGEGKVLVVPNATGTTASASPGGSARAGGPALPGGAGIASVLVAASGRAADLLIAGALLLIALAGVLVLARRRRG